jgi:4'-phosphopantetheinyl transferase
MNPDFIAIKTPETLPDKDFDNLLSYLPEERVLRIRKFLFRKSALHTLAGEMITRTWISKKISLPPQELRFIRDQFGKPSLINRDDLFFNIAHSGHWVTAAFDSDVIGIDVESMREIDLSIAERFFSKKEYDSLMLKAADEQHSFFYDLWTLKESYIKAEGKGLSIPLDSFCFTIDKNDVIRFEIVSGESKRTYFFKQYPLEPQYKCAVCSSTGRFPPELTIVDWDKLCDDFLSECNKSNRF